MSLEKKREEAAEAIAKQFGTDAKNIHVCMADDMHPFNCDGMFGGACIHCDGVRDEDHDPDTCELCHYLD